MSGTDHEALPGSFLLQRVQPALSGLMDGSLSTLAPIFAVVLATHRPLTAFFTGLATALGAGVSMAFSEGLSDTGDLTGRGKPIVRGAITGGGTFLGGVFHTLPFLISDYNTAIVAGGAAGGGVPDQLRAILRRGRRGRCGHRDAERGPRVGRELKPPPKDVTRSSPLPIYTAHEAFMKPRVVPHNRPRRRSEPPELGGAGCVWPSMLW
jgi:hypothetical protein